MDIRKLKTWELIEALNYLIKVGVRKGATYEYYLNELNRRSRLLTILY
ncbi:hypothetical protein [Liquorilactobacillus mali]|nr:hypothetical protein [Liquorilactobacillus mali]